MNTEQRKELAETLGLELDKLDAIGKELFEIWSKFRSNEIMEAKSKLHEAQRQLVRVYETIKPKIKLTQVPIM